MPEGVGKVAFARSFIDYFITIATLGISTYGIRETAKVRDNREQLSKVSKEILTINMCSTAVAYLLLFAAMFIVPKLADYRPLLVVISAKILFTALGLDWLYGGMEEYKYITALSFIFQVISVILLFVFVHNPEDYLIYASIAVVANIGSNVCNWIHSKKYIDVFSYCGPLELGKHLKPVLILFAVAEVTRLYHSLDVTMLGFICGDWEVGIYTAATRINNIIVQLVVAIGVVVIPRLSYYMQQEDKEKFQALVYKNFDMFFLLAIPAAIGLGLVGKAAILAFSGERFLASVPVMRIMNSLIVISGISSVVGTQTFVPMGKERLVLHALLVSTITNIVLNLILIPRYAVHGAAIATLVSQSVLSIMELFWCREIVDLRKVGRFLSVYLFNSMIMALCVLLSIRMIPGLWPSTFVGIGTGIFVYGLLLIVEKNHFAIDFINAIKRRICNAR